jgi:polyhydroxyalkanoate synthesis regulator phasin
LSETLDRRRNQVRRIVRREKEQVLDAEEELQARIAERLDRMSVPTTDDLDALGAKIAELSKKVDELKEARTS